MTKAEREAALSFILLYGKGDTATRKAKPRGKEVAQRQPGYKPKPRKEPPPFDLSKVEIEPITLEQLEKILEETDHSGED